MKKVLSIFVFVLAVAFGIVYAQSSPVANDAQEVAEEDYTEMAYQERMDMLQQLETQYTDDGNPAAAAFIRGQMEMLSNQ